MRRVTLCFLSSVCRARARHGRHNFPGRQHGGDTAGRYVRLRRVTQAELARNAARPAVEAARPTIQGGISVMLQFNRRSTLKLMGGAALAATTLPLPAAAQEDLVVLNTYQNFKRGTINS